MANTYMAYYSGKRYTLDELRATSMWQGFDHEYADRLMELMDLSIAEGHPVGIGGGIRPPPSQLNLFLSRHHVVTNGGCCVYNGKKYALNPKTAHAAPPNLSYHEPTTPEGKALAGDLIGDMAWNMANCHRVGFIHFGRINGESWHDQPYELPHSRRQYIPALHSPLKDFHPDTSMLLPPKPPAPFVLVPSASMRVQTPMLTGKNVADLQHLMAFWGWFKGTADGAFGAQTAQGVKNLQTALHIKADGVYGPDTEAAYRWFATSMSGLAK